MDATTKPKAAALEALSTARKLLAEPGPLTDMRMFQLRGLLEYAENAVAAISEIKRPRKVKESTT